MRGRAGRSGCVGWGLGILIGWERRSFACRCMAKASHVGVGRRRGAWIRRGSGAVFDFVCFLHFLLYTLTVSSRSPHSVIGRWIVYLLALVVFFWLV